MDSTSRTERKNKQAMTYSLTTFTRPFSSGKQKYREHLGLPAYKEGEPRTLIIKKVTKGCKEPPVSGTVENTSRVETRENLTDSQFSFATLTALDNIMKQAERQLEDELRVVQTPKIDEEERREVVQSMMSTEENVQVAGPSKKKRKRRKRKKKVNELNMKDEGCQIMKHTANYTSENRQEPSINLTGNSKKSSPLKNSNGKTTKKINIIESNHILLTRPEPDWVPIADVILGSKSVPLDPVNNDESCVVAEVIKSPPINSKKRKLMPEDWKEQDTGKRIRTLKNSNESDSPNSPNVCGVQSHAGDIHSATRSLPVSPSPVQEISSCTEAEVTPLTYQHRRSRKKQRRKTSVTKLSLGMRNKQKRINQEESVASTSKSNSQWNPHQRMKSNRECIYLSSGGGSLYSDCDLNKTSVSKTQKNTLSPIDVCSDSQSLLLSSDQQQCSVIVNEPSEPFESAPISSSTNRKSMSSTFIAEKCQDKNNRDTEQSKKVSSVHLKFTKKQMDLDPPLKVLMAATNLAHSKSTEKLQGAACLPETSESSCDPNSSSSVMEASSSYPSVVGSESNSSLSVVEATPLPNIKIREIIEEPVKNMHDNKAQRKSGSLTQTKPSRETTAFQHKVKKPLVEAKLPSKQIRSSRMASESEGKQKHPLFEDERIEPGVLQSSPDTTQASDISSVSSSSTEVLQPEGETCLQAVLKVFQEHFGRSKEENMKVLQKNSFNLLTSLVEMQSLRSGLRKTPSDPEETGESSGG